MESQPPSKSALKAFSVVRGTPLSFPSLRFIDNRPQFLNVQCRLRDEMTLFVYQAVIHVNLSHPPRRVRVAGSRAALRVPLPCNDLNAFCSQFRERTFQA